jgi:hypothetical protein
LAADLRGVRQAYPGEHGSGRRLGIDEEERQRVEYTYSSSCRIVRGVTGRKPKMRSTSWREDKGSEEGSRAIGLNAIRVQTHRVNVVES